MNKTRRVFISHTSEFAKYPERKSFIDAAIAAPKVECFERLLIFVLARSDARRSRAPGIEVGEHAPALLKRREQRSTH